MTQLQQLWLLNLTEPFYHVNLARMLKKINSGNWQSNTPGSTQNSCHESTVRLEPEKQSCNTM